MGHGSGRRAAARAGRRSLNGWDLLGIEAPGPRVAVLAGNDLPAAFYRPLLVALASRGVSASALAPPPFLGRPGPTTWRELVAATRERVAGVDVLAGHSLGALLALLVAAEGPPPERLVLLEPAVAPWACLARRAASAYRRDVVLAERSRFDNAPGGGYTRAVDPARYPREAIELHLAVRRAGVPEPTLALLEDLPSAYPLPARISSRVDVVRGDAAGWRSARAAGWLARRLRARLVVVPRAGHWLVHEGLEAVARELSAPTR